MKTTATEQISACFYRLVASDARIHNAHLLVHSERDGLHLNLADGHNQTGTDDSVRIGQPVFMASVGKLFTAVLVAMLHEQGKLSFDDRLIDFLEPDLLNGLHVFKGKTIAGKSA